MLLICMFIPGIISVKINEIINKKSTKKNLINIIEQYLIYVFIVNLIMNTLLWILAEDKFIIYTTSTFTYDFCLKYMWMSLIISVIIPFIIKIFKEKIVVEITFTKINKK